jgi:hypothetical protein
MMSTQDDEREKEQIKLFGLQPINDRRGNKYLPDATLTIGPETYIFELKSGINSAFTSGKMSRNKIEDWKRNDFFIFSQHKYENNKLIFLRHFVCTPKHLGFFFDLVIDKVEVSGHAGKVGLDEWHQKVRPLLDGLLDQELMQKLDKTMEVGTRYNDPRIPIKKIIANGGLELDTSKCLKSQLAEFIKTQ